MELGHSQLCSYASSWAGMAITVILPQVGWVVAMNRCWCWVKLIEGNTYAPACNSCIPAPFKATYIHEHKGRRHGNLCLALGSWMPLLTLLCNGECHHSIPFTRCCLRAYWFMMSWKEITMTLPNIKRGEMHGACGTIKFLYSLKKKIHQWIFVASPALSFYHNISRNLRQDMGRGESGPSNQGMLRIRNQPTHHVTFFCPWVAGINCWY